jgi:hypothetical protein
MMQADSTFFSWTALVETFLCTAHLLAGLSLGWYFGRRTVRSPAAPPLSSEAELLAPYANQFSDLLRRLEDVAQMASSGQERDEVRLATLLAGIMSSVKELQQKMAGHAAGCVESPPASAPAHETHAEAPSPAAEPAAAAEEHAPQRSAVDNQKILDWFQDDRRLAVPSRGNERRYPFPVVQRLAPRCGGELPGAESFRPVQCHDLSAREIRYISEQTPKEIEVVIGLGVPRPVKYMIARIEDYRTVYMYRRVAYLVTATFVAALPSEEYERFVAAEPAEACA